VIKFCCPKCHTTLNAPTDMAGAATRCPRCRCPVQVPVPSAFSPPRPLIHLPQRSWPRSEGGRLLVVGLGLFAAMLAGGAAVYAAMSLGGWLKDPGSEEKLATAGQTPDPGGTPPAKRSDAEPPVKPSAPGRLVKPPAPAPPKAPEPAPKAADPAQPARPLDHLPPVKSPAPAPPKAPAPAPPAKPPVPTDPNALNGGSRMVDDLRVTTLTLPVKGLLPCMLWADAEGSAFLALHSDTGVLRRISFPGLKVTKQKNLDGKFSWMSMSAQGLLLSSPDSERIWVVDPATLEVKTKIDVPKLRRAVSAPALTWAVACDQDWFQKQKLYAVDLLKKKAVPCAVPQGNVPGYFVAGLPLWEKDPVQIPGAAASVVLPGGGVGRARLAQGNLLGLDSPAVTPDGAYVYTQGYNLFQNWLDIGGKPPSKLSGIPTMFRFSVKNGKLTYQDCDAARSSQDGSSMGEITISPDSKFVCLPGQPSKGYATPIYPTGTFQKHVCTLDAGCCSRAVGFDLKAGYTYTQDAGHELIVLTPHGLKKKQYALERPTQVVGPVCNRWGEVIRPAYSRPWQEGDPAGVVQQYLIYPGGNQLVLLTGAAVYAVEVPRKE
jgi:hypothetical protein